MGSASEELRSEFIKVYSGVPAKMREEIIALVRDKPYNWNAAYVEVYGKTAVGEEILVSLVKLGLLRGDANG